MIKDNKFITNTQLNVSTNTMTYTLLNNSKLGEVFNFLPHGIINKTITGIGGTSLEIDSNRNSIIVEPYVMTAYNKAQSVSRNNFYRVHFYGKAPKTINTSSMLSTKNIIVGLFSEHAEEELYKYINSCKIANQKIKIICVADQLEGLFKNLNEMSNNYFKDFHLTFDEIDCFQSSSSYRNIMDRCLEIYKLHSPMKRTLLSATISKFSDPILNREPITKIVYNTLKKEDLHLVNIKLSSFSNEVLSIIENLKNNSNTKNDKILIACNHIKMCLKTIKLLEQKGFVNLKILCSENKAEATKDYFDTLPPSGILPGSINFITSRYFNGIDICERYHSIILACGMKSNLRLSPEVIYQINGRGRQGLISRILIYNLQVPKKIESNTYQSLMEQANELCKIFDFIKILKNSKYPNNLAAFEEIVELLEKGSNKLYSLCFRDFESKFIPSHLKIDAQLEEEDVLKTYNSKQGFTNNLGNWFTLKTQRSLSKGINTVVLNTPLVDATNLIQTIETNSKKITSFEILNKISIDNKGIEPIARIYELAYSIENIDLIKLKNIILTKVAYTKYIYEIKKLLFYFETHVNVLCKSNILSKEIKNYFKPSDVDIYDKESLEAYCMQFINVAVDLKSTAKYQDAFIKLLPNNQVLLIDSILEIETKKDRPSSLINNKKLQVHLSGKQGKQKNMSKIKGFKTLDIYM